MSGRTVSTGDVEVNPSLQFLCLSPPKTVGSAYSLREVPQLVEIRHVTRLQLIL